MPKPLMMTTINVDSPRLGASFRDPSGFMFTRNGRLYRQVNQAYQTHYDALMGSGLYDRLVAAGLLIAHSEVAEEPAGQGPAYRVTQPEHLGFFL